VIAQIVKLVEPEIEAESDVEGDDKSTLPPLGPIPL
jgi:hypothetical protein